MSKIYLEILDKKRLSVFKKLKEFLPFGYLSGGTALALQIAHRLSLDFDFFVKKPLSKVFVKKCQKVLGLNLQIIRQTGDQLTIITSTNIKIDFVYYWYPLISPLIKTSSIYLASIPDIAADKALTIGQRAIWRDYVDIFFLLKWEIFNLKELISLAKRKFKGEFNELLFLEQLVYFDDMEIKKVEFLKEKYKEIEIKEFLEKETKKYFKNL